MDDRPDDLLSYLGSASNLDPEAILGEDIFQLLGANDLPANEKQALEEKMLRTVRERVIGRLLKSLSEAQLTHLDQLIGQGDHALTEQYLVDQGIALERLFLEEATAYKIELATLGRAVLPG